MKKILLITWLITQNILLFSQQLIKPDNEILPVELVYFFSYPLNDAILLKWGTATEVNNFGFEVQRAFNNNIFDAVGFVFGSGNSNSPKHYEYFDSSLVGNGNYYYRLKQIDTDGHYKFSDTIHINYTLSAINDLNEKIKQEISIFPNPFNNQTKISITNHQFTNLEIQVFNSLGEKVEQYSLFPLSNNFLFYWNPQILHSGIYYLRINSEKINYSAKVVYLK